MISDSIQPTRRPATEADLKMFQQVQEQLYTAVISDALDELGYRDQALREFLRPISGDEPFVGWARTISCVDVYHVPEDPYAREIEAVDSILPGEVVVVSTAGSLQNAPWGELLSTAAQARGARGARADLVVVLVLVACGLDAGGHRPDERDPRRGRPHDGDRHHR